MSWAMPSCHTVSPTRKLRMSSRALPHSSPNPEPRHFTNVAALTLLADTNDNYVGLHIWRHSSLCLFQPWMKERLISMQMPGSFPVSVDWISGCKGLRAQRTFTPRLGGTTGSDLGLFGGSAPGFNSVWGVTLNPKPQTPNPKP